MKEVLKVVGTEVLILVVMEDSLGLYIRDRSQYLYHVLILVVMEDSLGHDAQFDDGTPIMWS